MNVIDYVIIGTMLISMIVGVVRGFVKELLSLSVWVLSVFVAYHYATFLVASTSSIGRWINHTFINPQVRWGIAFAMIFLFVLVVGALVNYLIAKLIAISPLAGLNRFLGFLFGTARGALIIGLALLSLQSSSLKSNKLLQHSLLASQVREASEMAWTFIAPMWQ